MQTTQLKTREQMAPSPLAVIGLTRDEVMTAREVADLLHLPVSAVYELARRGELPACRLGRTLVLAAAATRRAAELLVPAS